MWKCTRRCDLFSRRAALELTFKSVVFFFHYCYLSTPPKRSAHLKGFLKSAIEAEHVNDVILKHIFVLSFNEQTLSPVICFGMTQIEKNNWMILQAKDMRLFLLLQRSMLVIVSCLFYKGQSFWTALHMVEPTSCSQALVMSTWFFSS